jgi:hypothetical protein
MINGVTLMGLVHPPGEKVPIAGPAGPVSISGEPAAPLAVFRIEGWEPGNTPDGLADEAQGHKVLRLMESVGQAAANDRLDAADVGKLALTLHLPGGRIIEGRVPVAERVIEALQDDGRVDTQEALGIAGSIISAVISLKAA